MQVSNKLINSTNVTLENIDTNKNSSVFSNILAEKKQNDFNLYDNNQLVSIVKSVLFKINKGEDIDIDTFLKSKDISRDSFLNFCKNTLDNSNILDNISKNLSISKSLCQKYIFNTMQNLISAADNKCCVLNKNVKVGSKIALPFIFDKIKSNISNFKEKIIDKKDEQNINNAVFMYVIYLSFANEDTAKVDKNIRELNKKDTKICNFLKDYSYQKSYIENISSFKDILSDENKIDKLANDILECNNKTFENIIQRSDKILNQLDFKNVVSSFGNILSNIDDSKLNKYVNKLKQIHLKDIGNLNFNALDIKTISKGFLNDSARENIGNPINLIKNINFNGTEYAEYNLKETKRYVSNSYKDESKNNNSNTSFESVQISTSNMAQNIIINSDLPNNMYTDRNKFIEHIKNSIKTALNTHKNNNVNKIEINLNPGELGSIEINFEKKDNSVNINFKIDDINTKDIIQNSISELKKELPNSNVHINYSNSAEFSNSSNFGQSQQYKQFNEIEIPQSLLSSKDKKENTRIEDNYLNNTEFFI